MHLSTVTGNASVVPSLTAGHVVKVQMNEISRNAQRVLLARVAK